VQKKDFYLEGSESAEDVVRRAELLRLVLNKLENVSPSIISLYREVLDSNGVTEEQTGKLSLCVVGGRVHGESQLKTWSDIDTVITAEKPFLSTRSVFMSPEEQESLPEALLRSGPLKREMMGRFIEEILPRFSEMVGVDLSEEGIIEIKGYGDQRNQDVKNGLIIYSE